MRPKPYANTIVSLMLIIGTFWIGLRTAQAQVFIPPPDQDTPKNGTGGASRSGDLCAQLTESEVATGPSMTALLPESQYGSTLSPTPTILVYLPESTGEGEAFFSLKDQERNLHYKTNIPLSGETGIVSIQLPSEAALDVDKVYQWFFTVECDGILQPGSLVSGLLQRVELSPQLLQQAQELDNPLDQALFYGSVGIWYDMIAGLVHLREAQPIEPVIRDRWQEVLNSVGLGALVSASLIENP